ncbi:Imm10 family immunity protein [Methylibium rhizosphaerae]|uniref:Imm10 family immunity protein n=1 Tax=Methylibium rhizosphaerae TaxID=2570323 RepID=UPI001FEB88D4|nr:Imm10 family immunity protein [Methylibium rhizosphaerae]
MMNPFAFEARCVVFRHPDNECHFVAFADQESDAWLYLILQRSFEDDEQDARLGMNTYHVEWCSQENSGYGGIAQFKLKPNIAEIKLEARMAALIGGFDQLSISFQLVAGKYEALKEALFNIFAGSSCLEIADA